MSVVFPINPDDRFDDNTATEGQTVFAVSFPFQDDRDLTIVKVALDGTETELTLTTDYTLTGAGAPSGGQLTLVTGAKAGERILNIGKAVLDRLTSIVQAGKFKSKSQDDEHDRHRIIQQEITRDAGRALKAPYGDSGALTPLAGSLIGWNNNADGFANKPTESSSQQASETAAGEAQAAAALAQQRFVRVRLVTVANVAIATELETGDTIDGNILATGDLVLLTGQTAPAENGVYVVQAIGAALRSSQFDTYDEHPGSHFTVMGGFRYAGSTWRCKSLPGGTLDTTALDFVRLALPVAAAVRADNYTATMQDELSDLNFDVATPKTVTLPAAAVAGKGFWFRCRNFGGRGVRLAPDGAELIDGLTDTWVFPTQDFVVYCDGTGWKTIGRSRWLTAFPGVTFYVDEANGSDSNDGLAAGTSNALGSPQAAINRLERDIDCGTYGPAIQVNGALTVGGLVHTIPLVGNHVIYMRGDPTTPANNPWTVPDTLTGLTNRDWAGMIIDGFKISAAGSSSSTVGLAVSQHGIVDIQNIEWGAFTNGVHIQIVTGGSVGHVVGATEKILNDFRVHVQNLGGEYINTGTTCNMPNALTFTDFIDLSGNATGTYAGVSFTGQAIGAHTGRQHAVGYSALLRRNGATLPGATAGVEYDGGHAP